MRGLRVVQRIVTFKIDARLLRLLDRYARERRITRSEAIREAIVRLLESEGFRVEDQLRRPAEEEFTGPVIEVVVD